MHRTTLSRLIAAPLMILALAFAFAAPAMAGGSGEGPTGPTVSVSPPTISVDGGQVLVTVTLFCWDAAASDGHVTFNAYFEQGNAGGSAQLEAECAPEPQVLTIAVASQTGVAFHPGPVSGFLGFEVIAANGAGYGGAPIDQVVLPAGAGR